jgi:hypothetical protein
MKLLILSLLLGNGALIHAQSATEFPQAVRNYQIASNSENIDNYMEIFHSSMTMIDVGRTFSDLNAIRQWANREVIPNGDSFRPLQVVASDEGYAKVLVQWMRWQVYYYFWFNENDQITLMSLQYQESGTTENESVYAQLPANVALYFDAVKIGNSQVLEQAFTANPRLRVVNRDFNSMERIRVFAETEVYGGDYELVSIHENRPDKVVVELRFTPRNWSRPEPDAIYEFSLENGKISSMNLQYK